MDDLTIRRVRSLVYLESSIPDLAIMVRIDLEMMKFGLEMVIKQRRGCVRMGLFSSTSRECESKQGLCILVRIGE